MSSRPKGPKQQDKPNLPQSPKQPYGEPLSGNHQDKIKQQGNRSKGAGRGM